MSYLPTHGVPLAVPGVVSETPTTLTVAVSKAMVSFAIFIVLSQFRSGYVNNRSSISSAGGG